MRITLNFGLKEESLPLDFRRGFMSLIKSCLSNSEESGLLFERMYNGKINKGLTFSVFFPDLIGKKGNKYVTGTKAKLLVSSNDPEIISAIYNGSFAIKDFRIADNSITFEGAEFVPLKKVRTNNVHFKTISPLLINLKGNNLQYITPDNDEFENAMISNIQMLSETFLGYQSQNVNFEILNWRKMPVSHYNQTMTAVKGVFGVEADRDVLQLIYDIGLGVRRSQGFGMMDIIKQM